ncbi:MAG: hypothetical protein V4498_07975 [candidate division FCPU426 bacterium]
MPTKQESRPAGRCTRCGKVVVLTGFSLCYDCREEETAELTKAFEFLRTHPAASAKIIADSTGVKEDLVLKLLRGAHLNQPTTKPGPKKN